MAFPAAAGAAIASGVGAIGGAVANARNQVQDYSSSKNWFKRMLDPGALFWGDSIDEFERNANLQREFAQNSIQWKIEDAKRAGINPYYALGASGYSASPVQSTDDNRGAYAMEVGQALSNSILSIQSAKLQNKLLKTEIQGKEIDNMIRLQQVDQNAGLFNFAPNADRNGRQYIGFTDRAKALEGLFEEADGWYGTLRNLKLARAMYENAQVEAKNRGVYAGFDTNVGFSYLTKNKKDLGLPPVLTPVEIEKFERVAKRLVSQGASAAEVVLEIVGLLEKIGSKIPDGFLSFLK